MPLPSWCKGSVVKDGELACVAIADLPQLPFFTDRKAPRVPGFTPPADQLSTAGQRPPGLT
eukprot:2900807-Rhodomonas_salina.2